MARVFHLLKRRTKELIILLDYVLWFLFDPCKYGRINKNEIKKVLIIHLGAIGELLMTTPIIKSLKNDLGSEVHFMTRKGMEKVFLHNPSLRKVITHSESFKENLEMVKREGYDLAIILWPGSLNISLMCLLAGIKYRVGCFKMVQEGPAFFYTKRWFPLKKQHAIQSNLDMIRLLGLENKKPRVEFYFSEKDRKSANQFLKKNKLKKFAIVHPGFGGAEKNKSYSRSWPEWAYADICDNLISQHGMSVVLTGIQKEKELAKKIVAASNHKNKIISAAGFFSLQELGALVSKADLLVAPDTSVVHIASTFDTKILDLIGDESSYLWHPWTHRKNYQTVRHPYFLGGTLGEGDYKKKLNEIKKAIMALVD